MTTFTANEAKQHLGAVIDETPQAPVSITRHGRPAVVMTADAEYQAYLKHRQLKAEVNKGFDQIDRGEFTTRSMKDLGEEAIRRIEAKRGNLKQPN